MMAQVDLRQVTKFEWGIVGGAFVAFIGLFLHAYGVSYHGATLGFVGDASVSGWHFAGLWLPVFLLLLAAGLVAVRRLRPELVPTTLPVGTRVIVAAAALVSVLIVLIRVVSYPSAHGAGVSVGAKFGSYVILAAVIVSAVFAVLDLRESGEKLPGVS
jgi:hypothetical protein